MQADIFEIADALRGIANLGLRFGENEYDRDRYQRVLALSARLTALAGRENEETEETILTRFTDNLNHVSPLNGAEAAVLREGKVLLIKRHDTKKWALPGGLIEIGEVPAETAERELFEETGLTGRAVELLAVFDSRLWQSRTWAQLFHHLFLVDAPTGEPHLTTEALDVGFFNEDDLPPLTPGHHLRIPFLFRLLRGEVPRPFFDPG